MAKRRKTIAAVISGIGPRIIGYEQLMSLSYIASHIALWALVLFQGVLLIGLMQQLTDLNRSVGGARGAVRSSELPVGSPAPRFQAADLHSSAVLTPDIFDGRGGMILFVTPGCSLCRALIKNVGRMRLDQSNAPILAVCQGKKESCLGLFAGTDPGFPAVLDDKDITVRYRVNGSPSVVVIDPHLRIRGYEHPTTADEFVRLWHEREAVAEGEPVSTYS